jgi:hypothetical protein
MTTHRIELMNEKQTLFAEARRLLAAGEAQPDDRIETWRNGTLCMAGPVWAAAKLRVVETTGNGTRTPRFARWMPFPATRPARAVR